MSYRTIAEDIYILAAEGAVFPAFAKFQVVNIQWNFVPVTDPVSPSRKRIVGENYAECLFLFVNRKNQGFIKRVHNPVTLRGIKSFPGRNFFRARAG